MLHYWGRWPRWAADCCVAQVCVYCCIHTTADCCVAQVCVYGCFSKAVQGVLICFAVKLGSNHTALVVETIKCLLNQSHRVHSSSLKCALQVY